MEKLLLQCKNPFLQAYAGHYGDLQIGDPPPEHSRGINLSFYLPPDLMEPSSLYLQAHRMRKWDHACHRLLSDFFRFSLTCAHQKLQDKFLYFPVHAFAPRNFHYPASAISLSVPSSPWWKKASMAFTSAFHSAFNVNRKGTVSCYSPPSGCNAALKIP